MSKNKYESHIKNRIYEIEAWARDGITEKEMAERLGISYAAFRNHKKEHSQLAKALKINKEIFDVKLENALFKRALGYTYTEQTKELVIDKKTKTSELRVTKEVTKDIPPDVGALKFALTNRNKSKWSDRQEVKQELTGKDGGAIEVTTKTDLSKLSLEELNELEKIINKASDT